METEGHFKPSSLYKSRPRKSGQTLTSAGSGTDFRQVFQEQARNQGEKGYARQLFEERGLFHPPQTGHKQNNMAKDDNRPRWQEQRNPFSSDLLKSSTYSNVSTPAPEDSATTQEDPRFKRPSLQKGRHEPVQPSKRVRLETERNSRDFDDEVAEILGSSNSTIKRRRIEQHSPLRKTPQTTAHRPISFSSASSPSRRGGSTEPALASRSPRFSLSTPRRESSTKFKPPSSQLAAPISRNKRGIDITEGSRAPSSSPAPAYRPLKRPSSNPEPRQSSVSQIIRQQTNPNGSNYTDKDRVRVPTIDRQIKEPPPDLEGLNRVLQRVPHILTELSNKQERLIHDMATRVNDQEESIHRVETVNTRIQKQIDLKSKSFEEEMSTRFAAMEERMDAQDKLIVVLRSENAQLQSRIDGTVMNLTRRSNEINGRHSAGQPSSHEAMNVLDDNYNYDSDRQRNEGLDDLFDENDNFFYDQQGSGAIDNSFDENGNFDYDRLGSRDGHREAFAFHENEVNDYDTTEDRKPKDFSNQLNQCGNQEGLRASTESPQRRDPAPASTCGELERHDGEVSTRPCDGPDPWSSHQPTTRFTNFSRADSEGSGFTLNTPIRREEHEPKISLDRPNRELTELEG